MQAKFVSHDVNQTRPSETTGGCNAKEDNTLLPNSSGPQNFTEKSFEIASAVFKKQPPDNLRKSNFFHFDLTFFDSLNNEVVVEKATFVGFQEDTPNEKPLRNGIRYKLAFGFANGKKVTEEILVRLIDSSSKKPISYDGQDKNPDMCRVLLTHEVMCSRCCESKSCGNRNETPSDPVVMSNGFITRYHMKCNQNCLKNAGNPRETRRFQVMIGLIANADIIQLVTSENMFVHNNSKHGRRPNSLCESSRSNSCSEITTKLPVIHQIIPKEGKLSGCDEIAIVGENFFDGIQVAFGNQIAFKTEVLTSNLIKVMTPPCNGSLTVEIKCVHGCRVLLRGVPQQFRYNTELYDSQIDFYVERLWSLMPKQTTEVEKPARELVLRRAIELLEYIYLNNSVIYSPYENGHSFLSNMQSSLSGGAQSLGGNHTTKEQKHNVTKFHGSSDGMVEPGPLVPDYVRQTLMANNHASYEAMNGNPNCIMGHVLVGMNQVCDPISINNQSNFYVPYQGACEATPLAMNVNFPIKRTYNAIQ